jgi:CubicO group peptidase (beta-lactamase class C family)
MTNTTSDAARTLPTRDYWPTAGWQESPPDAQGMDGELLAQADRQLAADHPNIESLIVVRHGHIVHERYAGETGPDRLHNLKSATKSVLSLLIGIALQTGDLEALDDRLAYFFPEYFTSSTDSGKREISLRHLLMLRSGLEWDEWGPNTIEMMRSDNWIRYVLERPLAHEPGTVFTYSTGDTQLLVGALQKASGLPALEFANLYLFQPLGITQYTWPTDPQGYNVGGADLSLSPRDMAKIGYLVLNQGQWDGQSLVRPAWIEDATRQHSTVVPPDAGSYPPLYYGYLWWLRPQAGHASAIAVGLGGQFIYVVPALDLVVVMTGRLERIPQLFRNNGMIRDLNVLEDFIVPAVQG